MSAFEQPRVNTRATLQSGLLIGIGLMAAIDEIVFHQLLAWHHFVDARSGAFALFSDGLLHAGELLFLVAGAFIARSLLQAQQFAPRHFKAALLLGAGGFQIFDGVVDHKILGLHQVRYVDPVWPYDVAWIGAGLLILVAGMLALRNARRHSADQ
ncbi:DUF2243 domain-containing protein [Salinisphaera sp.]|uniref:DUF2243 domain-containing protein n=1 Tax=Salinisphaera sp. TaxID=1914330 RepID=UPI000C408F2F|nr:DUF2243 domain-containing protein [Salinisphaera sp.]MBS61890.1 hypothetical protein [Salinisphaera sp.]